MVLKLNEIEISEESEHQEKSYIGRLGKFIEPAMEPLGFDWKVSVSLLSGIAAKEVVVSTFGVMYKASANNSGSNVALGAKLAQQKWTNGPNNGKPVFTSVTVMALIMFVLIYFPCIAVVAAIKKETGSWKWAAFVMFYTTAMAWLVAFLVNQIGGAFV